MQSANFELNFNPSGNKNKLIRCNNEQAIKFELPDIIYLYKGNILTPLNIDEYEGDRNNIDVLKLSNTEDDNSIVNDTFTKTYINIKTQEKIQVKISMHGTFYELNVDHRKKYIDTYLKLKSTYGRDLVEERIIKIENEIESVNSILKLIYDEKIYDKLIMKTKHLTANSKFCTIYKQNGEKKYDVQSITHMHEKIRNEPEKYISDIRKNNIPINDINNSKEVCFKYLLSSFINILNRYKNYLNICVSNLREDPYNLNAMLYFNDIIENKIINVTDSNKNLIPSSIYNMYNNILIIDDLSTTGFSRNKSEHEICDSLILCKSNRVSNENKSWNIWPFSKQKKKINLLRIQRELKYDKIIGELDAIYK